MNPDNVRLLLQLLTMLGALVAALYTWFMARNKRTQQQIDHLAELCTKLDSRMQLLERDNHYAPGQGDIQQINQTISNLHGDLRHIAGRLEGINRAVDNMHRHLMSDTAE